jgi:hypothetical protein
VGAGGASAPGANGGGTVGVGGTVDLGGSGGAADGGGVTLGCPASTPPSTAMIADFSLPDVGVMVAPMATSFTYGGTPVSTAVVDGAWRIMVNAPAQAVPQYIGAGLALHGETGAHCVDAGAYTGIHFRIRGSVAACIFGYSVTDSAHLDLGSDPRGAGSAGSYGPQSTLPPPTGAPMTISIPFAGAGAPLGGSPAFPIDRTKLTHVLWQFTIPPAPNGTCTADVTIDDVGFY